MKAQTTCLLVDDHILVRDALGLMIQAHNPEITLIFASSASEACNILDKKNNIDLILLDLHLPDSNGIETVKKIHSRLFSTRLIVLSADDTLKTVYAALDAGAAGFISKSADSNALLRAIKDIAAGRISLPISLLDNNTLTHQESNGQGKQNPNLSERQMDVLKLLIEGSTNKSICQRLKLSESTVKTHIAAIFDKLGVNSRTQAVVEAARLGVSLSPDN